MTDETVTIYPHYGIAERWVGDMMPVRVLDGAGTGTTMDEGWVLGYLDSPSILLLHADGTSASWSIRLPWQVAGPPTPPARKEELIAGMRRRSGHLAGEHNPPVDPARDAVIEAAGAYVRAESGRDSQDAYAAMVAALDRLAETAQETASLSPPAAEQATPAPQDTTDNRSSFLRMDEIVDWHDEAHQAAGLSAEQEIRKVAAELLIADHAAGKVLGWKLGDWCRWIRVGRTPEQPDA